jgi:septum site-determining protein MinD
MNSPQEAMLSPDLKTQTPSIEHVPLQTSEASEAHVLTDKLTPPEPPHLGDASLDEHMQSSDIETGIETDTEKGIERVDTQPLDAEADMSLSELVVQSQRETLEKGVLEHPTLEPSTLETDGSVEPTEEESLTTRQTPVATLPTIESLDQRHTGRVVVITSGKGGVGKTTTTANIGTGLARLGYSVVMVDTDIGLRNLDILMGLENRIVYNLVDVVEGRCKLHQALVKDKRLPGLMLLPAAQTRDKSAITEAQMLDLCHQLKQLYDFILLDCPAGIEQGFQNAISAASEAIVVCTPEMSSVRDADRVIGLLEARETVTQYRLVVNRVRPQLIEANDMMAIEDVLDILAINLLGVIPEDSDIIVSTNRGEPVVLDEASMAGQAYRNIARRIAGEDVPLLDLMSREVTWLEKLRNFFAPKKSK